MAKSALLHKTLSNISWIAVSAIAGRAHAWDITPRIEGEQQMRADVEAAITRTSDEHSTAWSGSPLFRFSYYLADAWDVSGAVGLAWVNTIPDEGENDAQIAPSNVILGTGLQSGREERPWRTARISIALPLAQLPDHGTERALALAAYDYALAARGLFDPWVWAPEQGGIAVQGAAATVVRRSRTRLVLAGEGGLGLTVPIGDSDASTQFFGQVAGEALIGRFGLGPRIQAIWMPLADTANFQTSAGLVVVSILSRRVLFKAQVLMNLDAPLADTSLWGFKLGMSAAW
jgi:hypothetical protein